LFHFSSPGTIACTPKNRFYPFICTWEVKMLKTLKFKPGTSGQKVHGVTDFVK